MQQISNRMVIKSILIGNKKTWNSYRQYILNGYIELFIMCSLLINGCIARGPHHPKSDVDKVRVVQQKHINEHLAIEAEHIEQDLKEHDMPEKNVATLSEDEKNYLFFKIHDLDGNDKLDGLEIYYSATHHSGVQHEHQHEKSESEDDDKLQLNDSESLVENKLPNFNLQELDENGQVVDANFNHIIDILDNFLNLADLNNDGLLDYAEYVRAIKIGDSVVDSEQKAEL